MCQICKQKTQNVSVQLKNSAIHNVKKLIFENRKNPLSIKQLFDQCLNLKLYRLTCETCLMELAEEQLFKELEEVHLSRREQEMIMTAKRYIITLETDLVTDIQMADLIAAMTKVGGKLDYKEIPRSSIIHKKCEENLHKMRRLNRQQTSSTGQDDQQMQSLLTDEDPQAEEQMEDEDEDTTFKEEIEETYIDSFGNERPLEELRGPIETEEEFRHYLEQIPDAAGNDSSICSCCSGICSR